MDEEFSGCICCMDTIDLFNLFTIYSENVETYAKMLETCFNIKVTSDLKHICKVCARKLEEAAAFREQTAKSVAMLQSVKDEEYLDESILEEAEYTLSHEPKLRKVVIAKKPGLGSVDENEDDNFDDMDDDYEVQALDETACIYCELTLPTAQQVQEHVRSAHGIEPRTGFRLRECSLCGATLGGSADDHFSRCHGVNSDVEARLFPCHFCANVYNSRKACYTHLRMKHGLKLSNDQTPKYTPRERKKCHICNKDFSQKQILNKHLWKAHGFEVEKRKAFVCPLCSERVSYGTHFSEHLLHEHGVHEQVEKLEFQNMNACPYYEPREPKKPKPCHDLNARGVNDLKLEPEEHRQETDGENTLWICDACGKEFVDSEKFRDHIIAHGLKLFPCQNCDNVFQNIDAWNRHLMIEHNVGAAF